MLFIAQEQNSNFLSLSAMNKVAEILEMPPIDVYEVASFYTMFNRTKVGRFHLQVCGTTPCMVRGAEKIISALEDHLHIRLGETTPDMMFTISEVECLGACVNAPMMQVNNQWVYEDLDEQNVIELIEKFRSGNEVKVGPQNHRKNSEGPIGRTSLQDVNWLQQEQRVQRDFGKAKTEWEKAKEEAAKVAQAQAQAKATSAPPTPPSVPSPTPPQSTPTQTVKPTEPSTSSNSPDQKTASQKDTQKESVKEEKKVVQEQPKEAQKQTSVNQEAPTATKTESKPAQAEKPVSQSLGKSPSGPEIRSNKNVAQKVSEGKAQTKQEPTKTGSPKDKSKK